MDVIPKQIASLDPDLGRRVAEQVAEEVGPAVEEGRGRMLDRSRVNLRVGELINEPVPLVRFLVSEKLANLLRLRDTARQIQVDPAKELGVGR